MLRGGDKSGKVISCDHRNRNPHQTVPSLLYIWSSARGVTIHKRDGRWKASKDLLAIESALASGRQLSWKVQENNVGMFVQLVWKSSESRNLVGSKLKKKPPSRQRRDALRLLKFNAARLLNKIIFLLHILLRNPVMRCHKSCLLLLLRLLYYTTTRSTFPEHSSQLMDRHHCFPWQLRKQSL